MATPFDNVLMLGSTPPSAFGADAGLISGLGAAGFTQAQAPLNLDFELAPFADANAQSLIPPVAPPMPQPRSLEGVPLPAGVSLYRDQDNPVVQQLAGMGGFGRAAPDRDLAPGGLSWDAIERAIDNIESGGTADRPGRYDQLGPQITNRNSRYFGDRAYGRFQFMGRDIPDLTERYFGQRLTPQQFLRNQEAQHAVFRGRFGEHLTRFGNPLDAAQAHFAGPGSVGDPRALNRTDAQEGFRGTSVRNYRNMFASGLSRYSAGSGRQPDLAGATMELSPDMAAALGLPSTTMPAPGFLTGMGAAMAPGLASPPAAPTQSGGFGGAPSGPMAPPNPQFGPGHNPAAQQAMPFGDLWQNTLRVPSTGLTQLASYMAQSEPAEQMAIAEIYRRGQEIQAENPGISPQQTAQMLLRDPVFARNAMLVGKNAPAVLSAAVQPVVQPQVLQGGPGTQFFSQQGGQVTPMGIGVPTTPSPDLQMLQHIMQLPQIQALPPEQQFNAAIAAMGQMRMARSIPSDREQAIARIQQSEAAGVEPSIHDLQLAGYLRVEPQFGPTGNVIGSQVINTYRGGGTGAATSRYPGSAAPPVAPGAPAGAPGSPPLPPPGGAPGAPPSMVSPPRVIGRRPDGREVRDTPELSLQTSLIRDPAEMVLGAGPVASFLGAWGRVVGNLYPGSETEVLSRQTLMDQFRAAYTQYIQATKLKSEHEAAMAAVPTSGEIFTNPLRATNQFVALREGLVRELELAIQQAADQTRDPRTRQQRDERIAAIQGVLLRMPSQEGLYNLAARLSTGEAIAGTRPSEVGAHVGEAAGVGRRAVDETVGGGGARSQPSALPADLNNLGLADLQRLSRRENLSPADRQRLIQAIRDLDPALDRPRVPRSR